MYEFIRWERLGSREVYIAYISKSTRHGPYIHITSKAFYEQGSFPVGASGIYSQPTREEINHLKECIKFSKWIDPKKVKGIDRVVNDYPIF